MAKVSPGYATRLVVAGAVFAGVVGTILFIPWASVRKFMAQENDDRPAWVELDGQAYRIALFPELYQVLGNRYGGNGTTTFAVPNVGNRNYDSLANQRFGVKLLTRCMSTRDLEDETPVGKEAWCRPDAYAPWVGRAPRRVSPP